MELPEWVDLAAWNGWIEMRDKNRWGLTERAKKLALMRLEILRKQGQDPNAVLDQSTMMSWRGLFPVKEDYGTSGRNLTKADERSMRNKEALSRVLGGAEAKLGTVRGNLPPGDNPAGSGGLFGSIEGFKH